MNTTELVFFIILSVSASTMFLVFASGVIYFVTVLKQIKKVTERAENVADTMEAAASSFERAAAPLAILKLIGGIMDSALRGRKRR